MEKKKRITDKEIIERLKWFHGDDFEKYPLEEELVKELKTNNSLCR